MAVPSPSVPSPQSTVARQWFLAGIRGWSLLVLTLHLAAYSLPPETSWSLWPYTFIPLWLGWPLALLVALPIIPPVNRAVWQIIDRLGDWAKPGHRQLGFGLLSLLAGLIFWLARLRHLRWGDSYLLSIALSYPDLDLRVIYNWQAPFTVFLHQRLWQYVANPMLGWPVESVYATVSITCGMAFVFILLNFTARLGRTPLEAGIMAGLVFTTGSMQLFFGYVENYTIISMLSTSTANGSGNTLH